jgi:uncharacterized protein YlxW (UPF0749 family)
MSTISSLSAYVKLHERLIGLVLAAAVIWGVSGKIESVVAKHDKSQETQAQIVANAQQSKDAALATQAAQQAEQYKELSDKVAAQNAALEQANITLATALAKQQHTDDTMPLPELAQEWTKLVPGMAPNDITFALDPNGQITLTDDAAHKTVDQLEQVPVLTQQLSNTKGQLENVDSLLGASQKQVVTLDQEVSGLNLQLVDNQKVCTEQLKMQADQYKKSRWHWFWAGMAAGFLGRSALIK